MRMFPLKVKPFEPEIETLLSFVDSMRAIGWHKPAAFVWPASHLASQLTVNDFWYLRAHKHTAEKPEKVRENADDCQSRICGYQASNLPDQLVKFQNGKFSTSVYKTGFLWGKHLAAATSIRFMCFLHKLQFDDGFQSLSLGSGVPSELRLCGSIWWEHGFDNNKSCPLH